MKMKLKLLKQHGALRPGVYTFSGKLATYLQKVGKAVPYQKEEKKVIETKEEKFIPETKEEKEIIPVSKLDVGNMSDDELEDMIENDERKTAVRMAEAEMNKRFNADNSTPDME